MEIDPVIWKSSPLDQYLTQLNSTEHETYHINPPLSNIQIEGIEDPKLLHSKKDHVNLIEYLLVHYILKNITSQLRPILKKYRLSPPIDITQQLPKTQRNSCLFLLVSAITCFATFSLAKVICFVGALTIIVLIIPFLQSWITIRQINGCVEAYSFWCSITDEALSWICELERVGISPNSTFLDQDVDKTKKGITTSANQLLVLSVQIDRVIDSIDYTLQSTLNSYLENNIQKSQSNKIYSEQTKKSDHNERSEMPTIITTTQIQLERRRARQLMCNFFTSIQSIFLMPNALTYLENPLSYRQILKFHWSLIFLDIKLGCLTRSFCESSHEILFHLLIDWISMEGGHVRRLNKQETSKLKVKQLFNHVMSRKRRLTSHFASSLRAVLLPTASQDSSSSNIVKSQELREYRNALAAANFEAGLGLAILRTNPGLKSPVQDTKGTSSLLCELIESFSEALKALRIAKDQIRLVNAAPSVKEICKELLIPENLPNIEVDKAAPNENLVSDPQEYQVFSATASSTYISSNNTEDVTWEDMRKASSKDQCCQALQMYLVFYLRLKRQVKLSGRAVLKELSRVLKQRVDDPRHTVVPKAVVVKEIKSCEDEASVKMISSTVNVTDRNAMVKELGLNLEKESVETRSKKILENSSNDFQIMESEGFTELVSGNESASFFKLQPFFALPSEFPIVQSKGDEFVGEGELITSENETPDTDPLSIS